MKISIFFICILFLIFSFFSVNAKPKPIIVTSYDGTPSLFDTTYNFRCPSFRLQVEYSRVKRDKKTGKSVYITQILLNGKKTNVPENFENFLNERMLMSFHPICSNEPGTSNIQVRIYGYFPFRGPERYYEGVLVSNGKLNDISFSGSERPRDEFSPLMR